MLPDQFEAESKAVARVEANASFKTERDEESFRGGHRAGWGDNPLAQLGARVLEIMGMADCLDSERMRRVNAVARSLGLLPEGEVKP